MKHFAAEDGPLFALIFGGFPFMIESIMLRVHSLFLVVHFDMSDSSNKCLPLLKRISFALTFGILGTACLAQNPNVKATHQADSSSTSFQQLSTQATAAISADNVDDAIPLLHKALTINPRWVEGWWDLGTALYDQDRYAEAALAFQKVVDLQPKHGTAHGMLGLCQFETGDEANALRNIEAAKNLGTSGDSQLRDVIFYHEGVLLQRSGRFIAAQAAFASLCRGHNVNDNLLRAFGMAVLQIRDKQPAPSASDAGQVEEMAGHASCLAAQTDYDSARREFELATTLFPHFPYVHYAFGRQLVDATDISGAVTQLEAEYNLGHDRLLPALEIASIEFKHNPGVGLHYAEIGVQLAPRMPFAHFLLGLLLMNNDRAADAIPELEFASKGLPKEPRVFWSLGSAYAQMGRSQDAVRARAQYAQLSQSAKERSASQESPVDLPAPQDPAPKQ